MQTNKPLRIEVFAKMVTEFAKTSRNSKLVEGNLVNGGVNRKDKDVAKDANAFW